MGKRKPIKTTLEDAINEAMGEVETLKEEMSDWRDNLDGGNMSHVPKYEEVSDCCDELESVDEVDLEPFDKLLKERHVDILPRLKSAKSRADRLSHATYILELVIADLEAREEELRADGTTQGNDEADKLREFIDELEERKSNMEGVSFPGMY